MHNYYVYILASSNEKGKIYIGVTNNLIKRVYEHKNNFVESYTSKHKIYKLVYFEQTNNIISAISREKQLKNWHREWKINLIKTNNPDWKDLYDELV